MKESEEGNWKKKIEVYCLRFSWISMSVPTLEKENDNMKSKCMIQRTTFYWTEPTHIPNKWIVPNIIKQNFKSRNYTNFEKMKTTLRKITINSPCYMYGHTNNILYGSPTKARSKHFLESINRLCYKMENIDNFSASDSREVEWNFAKRKLFC